MKRKALRTWTKLSVKLKNSMISEKIEKFLKDAGPIFFVTPSPVRAIGLEKSLPDFHIICSENSDTISEMQAENVKIFLIEGEGLVNAGKILRSRTVIEYIKENSKGRVPNIITFKSSPMIAKVCEENGFRYLGSDWKLNRRWEDKILFAEITNDLGVSNANSRVLKAENDFPFENFDFSNDKKFVIQFSRGYSGNSSFLIDSLEEMQNIISANQGKKTRIARYIQGDSYTLDVCIGKFGVLMSYPIFQITGFSEFNKNILGTCGNDYAFAKNLSDKAIKNMRCAVEKISKKMFEEGYIGIAGFDFVFEGDEIHMIEVNPRLVGSIPVLTKLQIASGDFPFLLLHILSFMDFDFQDFTFLKEANRFDFSQLIFRNNSSKGVVVEKIPATGVYEIESGHLCFVNEAYFTDNSMKSSQFFIQTVGRGSVISPDMEYANIQFPYGIMENRGEFSDNFKKIKDAIYKEIVLK